MSHSTFRFTSTSLAILLIAGIAGFAVATRISAKYDPWDRPEAALFSKVLEQAEPGAFTPKAVESAVTESRLPVAWLGESFAGLNLVAYVVDAYPARGVAPSEAATQASANGIRLIYGSCRPVPMENDGPSCVPPLQIMIAAPEIAPRRDEMPGDRGWSSEFKIRGVSAMDTDSGTVLWLEDGSTVTVHAPAKLREAAIRGLRSANHTVLGVPQVGLTDPLSGLKRP